MAWYHWLGGPITGILGNTGGGNKPKVQDTTGDPSTFAPEPLEGNSLTVAIRSLQNQLGTQSGQAWGLGTGTFGKGLDTAQPSIDYWTKILSGDRAAIGEAISPETRQIAANYEGAKRSASMYAPAGGGRAAMLGQLPFQRGAAISDLISGLRPQAASQLQGLAQMLLQAGLSQEQIAQALGSTALGGMFQMRGQDLDERGQNINLGNQVGQGIGKLIGSWGSGG